MNQLSYSGHSRFLCAEMSRRPPPQLTTDEKMDETNLPLHDHASPPHHPLHRPPPDPAPLTAHQTEALAGLIDAALDLIRAGRMTRKSLVAWDTARIDGPSRSAYLADLREAVRMFRNDAQTDAQVQGVRQLCVAMEGVIKAFPDD